MHIQRATDQSNKKKKVLQKDEIKHLKQPVWAENGVIRKKMQIDSKLTHV